MLFSKRWLVLKLKSIIMKSQKSQKVTGNYSMPYTITAAWTVHFIMIIGFIYLLILLIFIFATYPNLMFFWTGLPTLFIIWGGGFIWAKSYKIILQQDKIVYRALLSRVREIPFSDISIIKIGFGLEFSWVKPPPRGFLTYSALSLKGFAYSPYDPLSSGYYLKMYNQNSKRLLSLNVRLFHRRDLAIIVDAITTKVPSIEIDENVRILKESYFASNLLEGVKDILPSLMDLLLTSVIAILITLILIHILAPLKE